VTLHPVIKECAVAGDGGEKEIKSRRFVWRAIERA
jgi:hypothetical protein